MIICSIFAALSLYINTRWINAALPLFYVWFKEGFTANQWFITLELSQFVAMSMDWICNIYYGGGSLYYGREYDVVHHYEYTTEGAGLIIAHDVAGFDEGGSRGILGRWSLICLQKKDNSIEYRLMPRDRIMNGFYISLLFWSRI